METAYVGSREIAVPNRYARIARNDGTLLAWLCGAKLLRRSDDIPHIPPPVTMEVGGAYWQTYPELTRDQIDAMAVIATEEFHAVWPIAREQSEWMREIVDRTCAESAPVVTKKRRTVRARKSPAAPS